jgi:hypothetical protein
LPNGSEKSYLYDLLNRMTEITNKISAAAVITQHQ